MGEAYLGDISGRDSVSLYPVCLLRFLYWESLQESGKPYPLQVKMAVGSRELSWMFPECSQSPSRDVYMMTEASSTDQCHTQLSNSSFCQVLSICKCLLLAKHVTSLLRVNRSASFWSICWKSNQSHSCGQAAGCCSPSPPSLDDIWTALFWWVPESNSSKIRGRRDLFHFFLNLDLVS